MKPELVSFKICPFVQRSVIVLKEKGIDFDINYINIKEPPDWFKEISPLGKVPLLKVGETVLFESAVIMEYLDEVNPPSLHPSNPLQKAKNRAWIEFASTVLMEQFGMATASDEEGYTEKKKSLTAKLELLEDVVIGPLFNGDEFSLADAAFAPFFLRLALLEEKNAMGLLNNLPKLHHWSQRLLGRPSVTESVVDDLPDLYRGFIANSGGYGAQRFSVGEG